MIKKIIFFFAWIGIFLLSLLGINFILFPSNCIFCEKVISLQKFNIFDLKMAMLAVCILYVFMCIYKFLSLFDRKKEYIRKTENGLIKISTGTINSYVIEFLKKDNDIGGIKVSSDVKGKGILVNIKLQVLHQLNVSEKINELQNRVKDNLRDNLGIEVKDVFVSVSNISAKESRNNSGFFNRGNKKDNTKENETEAD